MHIHFVREAFEYSGNMKRREEGAVGNFPEIKSKLPSGETEFQVGRGLGDVAGG